MDKAFIKNPVEAYEKLKEENKSLKESLKLISQTLNHTLQSEVDLYKRQIDNSVPDDWEYEEVLALVEEYIEKLKAELEKYKNVINKLAGKTIAITTYDIPIEFYDHKDLTIQQFKEEIEKLKEEKQGLIKDWEEKKNLAYEIACKNEKLKAENEELVTKCHQLGQENETLRQFLSKEPLALQALQSAYSDYKKRSEVFYEMLKDCKQCFEIDGFSKPDDCGICPYNKILEKISEVINER